MKRFLSAGEGYALLRTNIVLLFFFMCLQAGHAGTTVPVTQGDRAVVAMAAAAEDGFERSQTVLTGVVVDTAGRPMPGVTVTLRGSREQAVTDTEGRFSLTVPAGSSGTLVASYLGHESVSKRFETGEAGPFRLVMVPAQQTIEEVEINAGYYTTTDRYRTGSIGRVTAKEIENQPVSSPLLALHGRVPGVVITQPNGVPGTSVSIEIRGRNSLRTGASDPLYVVDGVPVSSSAIFSSMLGNIALLGMDALSGLNPQDIESIEILKDADATSIYGSKGANGVVLITTRQSSSQRTSIELAHTGGFSRSPRQRLLNTQQYLEMRMEAFANDGLAPTVANAPDLLLWDTTRYTDWQKELIGGVARFSDTRVSLSGGGNTSNFLVNAGWKDEGMVFPGDMYNRTASLGFNINHRGFGDKLSVRIGGQYGWTNNNTTPHNLINDALRLAPNAPALYQEDGKLNWENSTWTNPLATLEMSNMVGIQSTNMNGLFLYRIFKGLELKTSIGYTGTFSEFDRKEPMSSKDPGFAWAPTYTGTYNWGRDKRVSWIAEPQLMYKWSLSGEQQIDMLVGSTFQEDNRLTFWQTSTGYVNDALLGNIRAASSSSVVTDDRSIYRYSAIFSRIGYKAYDRYIFNLTGRRDGSSRFGPAKRFGNFWSVGGAWILSEESFFRDLSETISFMKLRGSYGTTGSDQIGDYGYLDSYSISSYYGDLSLVPSQLFNPGFSWEANRKLDAEFNLRMFKDRLSIDVGWFRNRSSNQLVGYPLPAVTGFTTVQANLPATVENKGWEFQLAWQDRGHGILQWETALNFSIPKNTLLDYPDLASSTYASTYVIGHSLGVRRLYHYTGISEDGIYSFEDYNGDGRLNTQDRYIITDAGRKYYGALKQGARYKGFSLDFLMEYVNQEGRGSEIGNTTPGRQNNQPLYIMGRWKATGDVSNIQKFSALASLANTGFTNVQSSDLYVMDNSFLRLRTLSVAYQFPESVVRWMRIKNLGIHAHMQNLFTVSRAPGWHVEMNGSSSGMPPMKTYTVGIRAGI